MSISKQWADDFAQDWIASWNAHDLARVLSHYTDDFEMSSPFIAQFTGEPSSVLVGKDKIAAYWQTALQKLPDLHFDLLGVFTGASSLVIHYRTSFGRLATEVFFINHAGLVYRAAAHYQHQPI